MRTILEYAATERATTMRRCVEGLVNAGSGPSRTRRFARWPGCAEFDAVHVLNGVLPRTSVPLVATLPSPFAIVPDDGIDLPLRREVERRLRVLTRTCARLHAWTDNLREEFLKHHPDVGERVDVVPPGVAPCFLAQDAPQVSPLAPEAPYFLCVGERTSVKNLSRVVQAFVRGSFSDEHHLVFVGRDSQEFEPIANAIRGLRLEERTHVLGVVEDEDLAGLYRGASLLMYPVLQEAVALPVLEALACGTPVVAADRWAAAELAGEHAELCEPLDVDAIVAATGRALKRDAARGEAARRHAAAFTWARTLEGLTKVAMDASGMR